MWEEFGIQRRNMLRKGKSADEGDPKKSWSGIETEAGVEYAGVVLEVILVGSTEKKEASHFLGLRGRHQYSDQRSNRNRAPCVASTAVGTEGDKDQMARL